MSLLLRILGALVSAVFWLIAGAVILFILSLLISVMGVFTPVLLYSAPFTALFALVIAAMTLNRVRWSRATSVLQYMEQAVRLNLPVPTVLEAAAESERGGSARTLRRVAGAMRDGRAIDEAVAAHVRAVPERTIRLMQGAHALGRLPTTLSALVEQRRATQRSRPNDDVLMWAYGLVVITAMLWLIGGLSLLILPKYREIFRDFDVALPWMTQVTFAWGDALRPWLLPLVPLLGPAVAGWAVWALLHGGERRSWVWRRAFDALIWPVPVAGNIARDRGLADACGLMVEAMRAGAPIDRAAAAAAELPMNAVLKHRVERFADALQTGATMDDAARQAKLPPLMVQLLATGQASADAEHVLRFLHRYYQTRFSRLREIVRGAAVPMMVLTLSLVVGWVVVSLILPLARLMTATNTFYEPGVF